MSSIGSRGSIHRRHTGSKNATPDPDGLVVTGIPPAGGVSRPMIWHFFCLRFYGNPTVANRSHSRYYSLCGSTVVTGKLMIICICHRVSERDIDSAVSEGASSLRQLNERLRVGTGCGACVEHVRDCLHRCLADDLANMGMQQA